MNVTRFPGLIALLVAAVAVVACGTAASPSPSASSAASAAASAAESASAAAPPSAEASESAAASDGGASAAPSDAIPGFSFPSEAAELEALLPDEVCGQTAQKFSFSGETFAESADETGRAVLERLGRTPEDVSMAVAAGAGTTEADTCGAGIVRIQGASTDQIREVFLESTEEEGGTVEQRSIGGRDVFEVTSDGDVQFVYFVGDAFVFVTAPEAQVEGLLNDLP